MAHPPKFINLEEAKKYVSYDPASGQVTLLLASKRLATGHVFSTQYPNNYVSVIFNGKRFTAHRLAYVLMTGKQPNVMDHINGLKHDNRWANLRSGTECENMSNKRYHRHQRGEFQKTDCPTNAPQE